MAHSSCLVPHFNINIILMGLLLIWWNLNYMWGTICNKPTCTMGTSSHNDKSLQPLGGMVGKCCWSLLLEWEYGWALRKLNLISYYYVENFKSKKRKIGGAKIFSRHLDQFSICFLLGITYIKRVWPVDNGMSSNM